MKQGAHLFFLGIAGFAMSGLALAARQHGYRVSGLDEGAGPPTTTWLTEQGLDWAGVYRPGLLGGADAVVISGQHGSEDHPIIQEARQRGLRIVSFAELFGELTAGRHVIAISGAHGKTTTTSLITWLLESAGRQPDYLVGIRPFNFPASSRLDDAPVVVVEGDEYKASVLDNRSKFDYYHPDMLVITSIEHDHPDTFPTLESVVERFEGLVKRLPATGRLVACAESPLVRQVAGLAPCPVLTYGLGEADYVARDIAYLSSGIEFDVETATGGVLGRFAAPLYGRHNVLNALAAIAVATAEGLSFEQILTGATSFQGVFRRFNLISPAKSSITVIDDYAHHPTEVASTIQAAKLHFPHHRLVVVFRPHTYSRVRTLLTDFQNSFDKADIAYITEIETAREKAHEQTVSGQDIVDGIHHVPAVFEPNRAKLVERVVAGAEPGDVVLCMSVGDHQRLAYELADRLAALGAPEAAAIETPLPKQG